MRFLFTTLQGIESEFYGRVGSELERSGHEVVHLTYSRRAARELRAAGRDARCLADLLPETADEAAILRAHPGLDLDELARTDPLARRRGRRWGREAACRHVAALDALLDDARPDIVVPEVGNELIRVVVHALALERSLPVLLLFYTIFPRPLRLYVDEMHAPIVPASELRELAPDERAELEAFVAEFTSRRQPIRAHRRMDLGAQRLRRSVGYVRDRLTSDRDNPYLRPGAWLAGSLAEVVRRVRARRLYRPAPQGEFVYFPLHVSDDYKIRRLIPHCADQAAIVERLARALPAGTELVLKEHPMSIGRNPLPFLRRLAAPANVRLLHPRENSHELISRARAVSVISSTVGLEALLYGRPVLTLGRPFYAGYGVTLDIDGPEGLEAAVPRLFEFRPDAELIGRFLHAAMRHCRPGAPVLVDRSQENALTLAHTLAAAAQASAARDASERAPTAGYPGAVHNFQTATKSYDAEVTAFEELVLAQRPVAPEHYDAEYFTDDWRDGDNRYDLETRRRIEDRNPALIAEVLEPRRALDVGCGPGFLMQFLHELGIEVEGVDFSPQSTLLAPPDVAGRIAVGPVTALAAPDRAYDLVICREVMEHLTVLQVRRTVAECCRVSSRLVYCTTRFHPEPESLLAVTTQFDVDPTHITLMTKELLRTLFVLEGFRRRADLEERMDWAGKDRVLVYERTPGAA